MAWIDYLRKTQVPTEHHLGDDDNILRIHYALKLTRSPGAMEAADVEALRKHGFDDRTIHDICSITCYFAFVNRLADGLGVELEPFHEADPLAGLIS